MGRPSNTGTLETGASEPGAGASCVEPLGACFDFFGAAPPRPRPRSAVFGGPTGDLASGVFDPCTCWDDEPFTDGAAGAASDDCCTGAPGEDPVGVGDAGSGWLDVGEVAVGPCSPGAFDGASPGACGAGSGGASPAPMAGGEPSTEPPPCGWAGARPAIRRTRLAADCPGCPGKRRCTPPAPHGNWCRQSRRR